MPLPAEKPVWRALWLLAWLLLLVRLGFIVAHQPLAGFANQFDMLRTTACVGLQPETDAPARAATPDAPIASYRRDGLPEAGCLPGSEVAIVHAALAIDSLGDTLGWGDPQFFPLRLLALTKALLLLLALGLLDFRLRPWANLRAAHIGLAALLLADPVNTLYLAGFYTEFASLLAAWCALVWPLPWLLRGRAPSVPSLMSWGVLLSALLLARFQHVATPFVALAWMSALGWRRGWPLLRLALPLALLLPALAATLHWQRAYQTIADANRWNSFFGAAMPAARDANDYAARLGLAPACAELSGSTWYLRRGRDARAECPAGMDLSRLRWLMALAREPDALARWIGRGVTLSGQWRPSYLGELVGQSFQRLPPGPLGVGASLADGIARLPWLALLLGWSLPLWLLLLQPPQLRLSAAAGEPVSSVGRSVRDWLLPMLAALLALGWAASLVGDGYSELARHLHLAGNAAVAAALLLPWVLWRGWRERAGVGRLLLLGVGGLALLLAGWMQRQAIAVGVLDLPGDERLTGAPLEIAGWAIDPRGVASVTLVHADGLRQALQVEPSAEFSGIFGSGVGRHAVRFRGRIEAPSAGALLIELQPRTGAATVIDRRYMR